MKFISKTFKLLPVLFLVFGLTACSDDDDNNDGPVAMETTVIDVALENNLTSLAAALEATGLVGTLQGPGPFTVFAPSNDAFTTFLTAANVDLNNMSAAEEALVTNILLNHVIIGDNIMAADLVAAESGYRNTGATGPNGENLSIYFNTANGVTFNGQSTVTDPDKTATNGTIHIVDTVIELPTIGTFATTNEALSTLVAVLDFTDNGTSPSVEYINTVLNPEAGPLTVFAPTNDAFGDVLAELGLSGLGESEGQLNSATTDAVLLYHLVQANVQSGQLQSGVVTTIGGDITIDADNLTITDANGRVSNIIASLANIQGINGVVHVIDKVILVPLG